MPDEAGLGWKFREDAEIEAIIDVKWSHLRDRLNGDAMPKWAEQFYRSMMTEIIRLDRHWAQQRKMDRFWLMASAGGGGGIVAGVFELVKVLTG